MKLEKKVAIVTGAGRGIGKATAIRLAEEGASVVVNDIDGSFAQHVSEQIHFMNRATLAVEADVSKPPEVSQMFKQVEKRFGRLDILVNNAGIRKDTPFHKLKAADLDVHLDVLLKGSFNCAQEAQRIMVRQNYGKIVNLSSPIPSSLGKQSQLSYASAATAIEGLTKALALELGRHNINVNCVAPDFIDTEMMRSLARREGMYVNDFKKFAPAQIPLRRLGRPEDVANVILFLASDASGFISGQVIYVRGGP